MATVVERPDHFAHMRGGSPGPRPVDPTLEYDRYKITPPLVRKLKDLVSARLTFTSREISMDTLLQVAARDSFIAGQQDMIRMIEVLMEQQDDQ